jgi:hypothetical protein
MLRKYVAGFIIAGVIAYVVLTIVLISVYGNAVVSTMASVALVIVTTALVYATFTYSEAANRQAQALTDPVVFFGVEDVANDNSIKKNED